MASRQADRQRASEFRAHAIFPTRTDDIFIGVGNDGTFRKLAKEIGKPELGTDPRFARNKDRIANRDALRAELAAVFSRHEAEPLLQWPAGGRPAGRTGAEDRSGADQSANAASRRIIEKDSYKGVASPIRLERTSRACAGRRRNSASTPRGARRVRLLEERDRSAGRQGRGLRRRTKR